MNKLLAALLLLIGSAKISYSQSLTLADTTKAIVVSYNIYEELAKPATSGATVTIHQPDYVKQLMRQAIAKNETGFSMDGYRLRIYSDNQQNSRQVSESLIQELAAKYPNVKAYRSYSSPYFRVSIGDFRTLNEARAFLDVIKAEYPKAYPVKEKISFPPL